ncbi:MAG: PH domain-containing protein [Longimicrobiales bacterium]
MTTTITSPTLLPAGAVTAASSSSPDAGLEGTRRPRRALLFYYLLQSIITGPGIIVLLPLRYFRFRTLRYRFDPDGVTMRWGILFRREVSLTYARIQDIHLVSNLIERWLGLGRVQIQTASGNAAAEMTIEGLADYERVRDELYVRMRGARGQARGLSTQRADGTAGTNNELAGVAAALQETAAELRALRELLSRDGAR